MSYRTLDIETDPAAQGFAGEEFDLILAANVLHATRDLRESLGHVKQLLAAEGLLVLLESTERRRWVDLIFGLTDGWWRFEDDEVRPSHPLLSRAQWCDLLTTCGFADVEALPGGEMILARAPVREPVDAVTWLVLADRTGIGAALAECLVARGGRCVTLQSNDQDDLPTVLRSTPCRGVIHLWGLDAAAEPGTTSLLPEQSMACGSAVSLVQMLAALPEPGRLWLVTRGATPLSGAPVAIAQTPLWGLGRVIALEHPDLRCTRIDLDPAAPDIAALATEILGQDREDQVAFRTGVRHVARLVRHQGRTGTPMAMRADQTYLVTGGLGGLGLAVARWMVARGARYLALLGRSVPSSEAAEAVQKLREAGAEIVVLQADVARQDELERALAQMHSLLPPLAGVMHAAGTLNDAPLVAQDWERFASVMAAKCDGAWHLHGLTHDMPLDFFVLFSSAVAVLGAATQANHAAANAFLDGLAHYRRALGLPAISINWGVWSRIGAAARRHVDAHTARHGMGVITPEQGVAMLEHILAEQPTQVVVLPDVDWSRFLNQFPAPTSLPMFTALAVSTVSQVQTDKAIEVSGTDMPQRIRQAPIAERQALMTAYLSEQVAQVIGLQGALDPDVSFSDLGFDSLMAVELKQRVEGGLGVELPVSKLLEGVNVVALGRLLLDALPRAGEAVALPKARVIVPDPAQRYEPFPLTDMQGAYWVGRQENIELGNIGCHLYTEVDASEVDITRLELVWRRLIERHEMLRAVFTPDGQQRILEWVPPYQIEILDLRHQDPEVVEALLHELRAHLSHRVFNPEEWPLFDVRATRIDERTVILHISFDLLILDAASIFQLRAEWARLYNDLDVALPPLTLSFRDYVLEEVAYRETDAYRKAEAYWKERLPTLPGGPELPLARNPSAITKPYFVRRLGQIEALDWERLRARARQAGLTPSGLLCAAYADVLAAWSKNTQFCLTLTFFNRPAIHPEIFDIVGDFTTTILVEVDARGATFAARAKKLHERLIADLDQSAYSGVRVMRDLSRVRKEVLATVPAVFTSAFGFRGGPYEGDNRTAHNKEELGKMVYSVAQTPQVWIDHQVSEFAGGLLFTWDVVEELFPEGVIDTMFKAYCDLLRDLAADEGVWHRPLATLVPATHLERRAVANATAAPVPEVLLHELFVAQAQQRPAQDAVVDAQARLTYGELDARSNGLAQRLRALGVQPNQLVAVLMEKGWEQVVAVLGVLKAGAAYLPIAPALPTARQRYLLENGDVAVVLTQSWLQPDCQGMVHIDVDTIAPSTEPLLSVQQPGDLAYVIYTSGSTGLPKGVMIDHRGAVNTVLDINQRFGVGPDDRVLALSSLSFDLSVYDIFGVLAAGGTIVLPEETADRDPSRWLELVHREGVTVWNSVPALMSMAAEYGQPLDDTLRLVMLSGDWIPLSLPERIRALAPRARVVSLGGATEASIWSIYYPVEAVDPAWHSIPYGWPLANQSFQVLNERLEPCPEWVTGQLFIGGIGLAQGYWKDADKTAVRFIDHPATGERLYATGDLGRYRSDGTIEFLGREDFQVKVQGHRIELGEIELALEACPGVRSAVVAAVGESRTDKRLVAFVVPERVPSGALAPGLFTPTSDVAQDIILDPDAKLSFLLSQPGIRQEPTRAAIALTKPAPDLAVYAHRRSHRVFSMEVISFERFSGFLACLCPGEPENAGLLKYRYPSAGSLYPVQIYIHVKPSRLEGVPGGAFYYHPIEHRLVALAPQGTIEKNVHLTPNQAAFEQAAFSVFLVGRLAAIRPLYGALARDFCLLEAGHIGQLLMAEAPRHGVGLCPIGYLHFDQIRTQLDLADDDVLLYSFVGGAEARETSAAPALTSPTWNTSASRLWDSAITAGRTQIREAAVAFEPEAAEIFKSYLDDFYLDTITNALRHLGVFTVSGQRYTADEMLQQCAIKPRYRRWLHRALTALADNELLHREGTAFVCPAPLPETSPAVDAIRGFDAFGFTPEDFSLLQRVVDNLPDILTERLHSADIYTARETPGIYETLFQYTNPVVREILGTMADACSRLRVLEVGAGVGSATRAVLSRLPAERTDYQFTDISAYFLQAAQHAFADYPFVRYGLLDIERHPEEQGYAPQSFDVIIATSVLHATRDVAESLRHLRALLVPEGLLVLVEETRFYSWFDLSMGLQQGFDRFTDQERRRTHPLLSPEQWSDVLTVAGFARYELLSVAGSIADALGFHVILAQAPQATVSVTPENLRAFLRQQLPGYMVPSHIAMLPELPLTPNGKVDRQALAAQHTIGMEERGESAGPQSAYEKQVAAIWQEVLGVEKVGRHDSFFDLGGDSLGLIQIHNQLRRVFQRDIPVADIFRHPTVAGIADLLQGGSATVMREPLDGLVTIHAEGDRIPLFVVPGVISTPQPLHDLVPYLGLDQPLYGWQAPGITGGEPLHTIEDQAAYYLRSLRVVQPHGPYLLAGYSFGGYPAFELAQQLHQEGEEVSLLLLIDTVVTRSQLTVFQDEAAAKGSIVRAYYAGFAEQLPIPYEEMRQRDPHEQFVTVLRQLKELGLIPSDVLLEGLLAVFQANFRAMTQYVIEAYPSQITLLRTVEGFPEEFHEYESTESLEDPALGWSQYAVLPVEVLSIPGSHMTMMQPPYIEAIAATLKSCIDKATRGLST
jgi:amino acid adenylation domain-containing protein